ncbi:unnamed protein product [Rotaria magnacalcarata]
MIAWHTSVVSTDFVYPLKCVFKISEFDKDIKDCVVVYERKMMLQAGALIDGVNLHLSKLTRKSRRRHRIAAPAEDGQHISFKSITSITLD